jgi:ABC-type transport system substrate-binding protein
MRSIGSRLFAVNSVFLFAAGLFSEADVNATVHPGSGGTLRVELRATSVSVDPREWNVGTMEFATNERLGALVFDRLVALDNYGRFQPQLASEWSHDAGFTKWHCTLRAGVKFSDGSPLTAADVVAALEPLLPNGQQISASGNAVIIQSGGAMPDLLEELASGRYFVYRVQPDRTLMGTGPFFVSGSSPATGEASDSPNTGRDSSRTVAARAAAKPAHLRFHANEETWSGRPFLDAIEVTLGVPPLRQLFDLQLGKADLVELSPDLVRRAMQENLRVWTSSATTLYGLRFDNAQSMTSEEKLREAFSLSLDRQTMASVLLQKQAEPASALLPQWLSGYAFLFTMETNVERAKELRASLPAKAATTAEPLRLRVDAPGDLPKLLGERVAVNARQAAILVQVLNRGQLHTTNTTSPASSDSPAGVHLFAWHYSTLSPYLELDSFVSSLGLGGSNGSETSSTNPEQLYGRERKLLEERRVLPLVTMPEYVGLGANVRDWMPARWGEWHLADVWLDVPEPAFAQPADSHTMGIPVTPPRASPGVKP